ncbi:MAG: PDZ domain-containing protein [Acidobacteriota bacterium]
MHRLVPLRLLGATLTLLLASPAVASESARLLLYPDIHRDSVVFVHGQDLWSAPSVGGEAKRLTAHPGRELFPKFSPDGEWIAFSADYTGAHQVWVMPAEGGEPKQLTFYTDVGDMPPRGGYDPWVLGWTPDGKILARMNRTPFGRRMGKYFIIDPAGGLEKPLEIPHGGTASFSPDGKSLAYTPIDREFRTWKRSRGGRAQDLWIYELDAQQSRRLTTFDGTDNFPMWAGDQIYFSSDRDYTQELHAYDVASGAIRQITRHEHWDVMWPSLGPENVVFTRGGALYAMALADESVREIEVQIPGGLPHIVPRFENVADNIESASLGPKGHRVFFEARGDLFSVPAERGATRRLTHTSDVRERDPAVSPDGEWLAYLSDATGEYEIYLRPTQGDGEPRQLTTDGKMWRYSVVWSPDSSLLAYSDRKRRLMLIDVESGAETQVDAGFRGDLRNFEFSPDSKHLLYTRTREDSRLVGLSLYSVDKKKVWRLGDGQSLDFSPTWSEDGRYVFFLSNRDFNLNFSAFEFNYLYNRATRIYAAALDPDAPTLFPLRSDEVEVEDKENDAEQDEAAGDGKGKKGKKDKKSAKDKSEEMTASDDELVLDPDGFMARTFAVPGIDPGNYASLATAGGALFFTQNQPGQPSQLMRYDLEARKADTVAAGVFGFELSSSGEKVLYFAGPERWHIVKAAPGQDGGALDLSGLRAKVDPQQEWVQMFEDSWRISRDFFYDENMHGMDWEAIGERYRQLVPHVAHRSDLDWILGEMVGELGAGHTYVQAGETERSARFEGGKLGAELAADDSGFYRFETIFDGENWHRDYRNPLTVPGFEVKEGEFLLAIDGEKLTTADNPYRLLEGKAEEQVTLRVNGSPSDEGARDVRVQTIASELNLRYIDWVKRNIELTDRLSGGRIGYMHLPNTAIDGNRMLQKLFYSQSNKEAMIVDDRYNGGGFIPDRMIEYLSRTHLAYWAMRDIDSMRTPGFAHIGPKVMLMNGYSSSGGDALPYFFRQQGLGQLIGTRTWGGLIGLNGNPSLMDGGGPLMCTFRIYDAEGKWVVENEGVSPDIEVFDTPESFLGGGDPSIEKAVEVFLEELAANPVSLPTVPSPPDLSRR